MDFTRDKTIARAVVFAYQFLIVGSLVFTAAMFGILTRPTGFLAAFWPANGLLLGLMGRKPALASVWGFIAAFVGFMAADLISGQELMAATLLTIGNLVFVFVGVRLLQLLSPENQRFQRPSSVLFIFGICAIAASCSAFFGTSASNFLQDMQIFEESWGRNYGLWFSAELMNGIILIPIMMTAPSLRDFPQAVTNCLHQVQRKPALAVPAIALFLSAFLSVEIGGPGAIAFTVPALLWCTLSYPLFITAILTSGMCVWKVIAVSTGYLSVIETTSAYMDATTSIRLGLSLLTLGPLTAGSLYAARTELLRTLDRAVSYDALTGVLARRVFLERANELLARCLKSGQPRTAVLMMDIDHFKQVNDNYGHAVGDAVLVGFAKVVSKSLRETDLLGRLGGEEFAVLLPRINPEDALQIAERLRSDVEQTPVIVENEEPIHITVSIGLLYVHDNFHPKNAECSLTIDKLLNVADHALYIAKSDGRNRIAIAQAENICGCVT